MELLADRLAEDRQKYCRGLSGTRRKQLGQLLVPSCEESRARPAHGAQRPFLAAGLEGKGAWRNARNARDPALSCSTPPPSTLCYYLTGHNSTREDLSHHSNSVRYMFPDCLSSLTSCPTDKAVLSLHVSGKAAAVENIQGVCVHGTASQGVRVHVPACKSTQAPEQASRESSATPGPGNLPSPPPSTSLKAGRKERAAWLHANNNNSQQPSKS